MQRRKLRSFLAKQKFILSLVPMVSLNVAWDVLSHTNVRYNNNNMSTVSMAEINSALVTIDHVLRFAGGACWN